MKLRAMPVVLLALVVLLPLSHLEFERVDDSWLLRVDGRPVDMAGALAQPWLTACVRS